MLYQLCFVLALAAASSGQRYSPETAPNYVPNYESTPYYPGGNDGSTSFPNPPITIEDTGFGRNPDGSAYNSTPIPPERTTIDYTTDPTGTNFNNTKLNEPSERCSKSFEYIRVEGSCDAYYECENYKISRRRLCPDGMRFDPEAQFPTYPCGYPGDIPCIGRNTLTQQPKPSRECPHQFGFFPVSKSYSPLDKCTSYIMCSGGNANLMHCPFGLAFDQVSGRCDWPERVPGCQEFLGFHCPDIEEGEEDIVTNYKYSNDNCYYFWSCQNGRARVLSCDVGLAFDPDSGRCVAEELVACSGITLNPFDDTTVTASTTDHDHLFI